MSVVLETSVGDITVDLYTDERPRCCLNFLKLCKVKYYNFSLFHTVQKNLVAQTGDPTATGRGGESIFAKLYGEQARFFEMEVVPRIKHTKKGQLSMVNNGGNMHGSQFFITLRDGLTYLDGQHTVFGEVAEGFDVLEKINNAFCDDDNRPYQDIRIYHTVILDDPCDDPQGLQVPDRSPGPTEEMLNSTRIAADEDIHKDDGMTEEELREKEEAREAKANAQLLEMVGDLPDVDVKPPDTVLFVCKLNPVTGSDDLETIFSRFGPIKSCEVIKDQKTGESLQYAFIEFENEQDCESAYFKMDNVLIDDRRIHVDFSQSVSKLKWQKGGKKMEDKDEDRPKYVIKDQTRKQGNYELVFEDDDEGDVASGESKKKKKKHKERRAHSSGSEDERSHRQKEHKEKKKKKKQSRSRSRSRDRGHRSRSRDRGHRSRSGDRGPRRRSRSPEERGKSSGGSSSRREKPRHEESGSHARDRRRDRSPDSYRHKKDRERDRERDRYR